MAGLLSQRELDDLLSALTSTELENSTPVKYPLYYSIRTKVKTFWLLYSTTVLTSIFCSFIGAIAALGVNRKFSNK